MDYLTSSDTYFDFICQPCDKDNKIVEAVKYCTDCGEDLCRMCIDTHRRFTALRHHVMKDCSKPSQEGSFNIKNMSTDGATLYPAISRSVSSTRTENTPVMSHNGEKPVSGGVDGQGISEALASHETPAETTPITIPRIITITRTNPSPGRTQEITHSLSDNRYQHESSDEELADAEPGAMFTVIAQFDVRLPGSADTTYVKGSTVLPDGRIVLTESNMKLYLLDTNYDVIGAATLHIAPYGVSYVGRNEVCVAMKFMKELHFLQIGDGMKVLRVFDVGRCCRDVAVDADGCLYVVSGGGRDDHPGQVTVYSSIQEPVRIDIWLMDNNNKAIFSSPSAIAISNIYNCNDAYAQRALDIYIRDDTTMDRRATDGTRIHVADQDIGVITLDKYGRVVWVFQDDALQMCSGVCAGSHGCVFACGAMSDNVVVLDAGGNNMGNILTHANGISRPVTVCYDCNRERLFVGMWETNMAKVFRVQSFPDSDFVNP